jgi:hypothetical protein
VRRFVLAAAVCAAGCTTVPAPVVSPIPLRSQSFALTWAATFSPARATILRPDGTSQTLTSDGVQSDGGGGDAGGVLLGAALMPAMASWHFADSYSDGELFAGWRQLGFGMRARLLAAANGTITSLVAGAKLQWVGAAGDGSLALEVSPPLGARLRGLVRVGFGNGRREYDVQVPDDLDTTAGHDNTIAVAHLNLFRWDGRIEALVGLATEHVTVSVQPYWVVYRGPITGVSCELCTPGVALVDFSLRSGVSVALTTRF